MAADHLGRQPVQLEELQRLCVVARGDLHLVTATAHQLDQRPEHEHVCARGHVDPDAHQSRSTTREAHGDDHRLRCQLLLEEVLVRDAPVVDRLEALALVPRELDVDLAGGDEPRLGDLDDGDGLVVVVEQLEPVARLADRLAFGFVLRPEPGRRGLLAGEHRGDELPPQLGTRVAELEGAEVVRHAASASMRAEWRWGGACSTWRSYQSVNESRPQSWRL